MKQLNDKVHSTLSSLLNGSARNYLQDAVITMRNGRYCLPVKAEYRGQVPGMIHDQSSTGSTLFVEPMSVVKINNDLKELELKIKEHNKQRVVYYYYANWKSEYGIISYNFETKEKRHSIECLFCGNPAVT